MRGEKGKGAEKNVYAIKTIRKKNLKRKPSVEKNMMKWDAGMETERMGDDGNGLFKKKH